MRVCVASRGKKAIHSTDKAGIGCKRLINKIGICNIGKFSEFSNVNFISFAYDWVSWRKGLECDNYIINVDILVREFNKALAEDSKFWACHSERSEESAAMDTEVLRYRSE